MPASSTPLLKVTDAALEQARMMLDKTRWAASRLQKLDRATILRISDATSKAGHG